MKFKLSSLFLQGDINFNDTTLIVCILGHKTFSDILVKTLPNLQPVSCGLTLTDSGALLTGARHSLAYKS